MSRLRFTISMSLDGFVAGPRQSLKDPLDIGGEQLHEWVVGEREHASARRASHQHRRHDHGPQHVRRPPGLVGGAGGAVEGVVGRRPASAAQQYLNKFARPGAV
jgi:hypothetical protein